MQTQNGPQPSLRSNIENVLRSKHPATVAQLAQIVMAERPIDETDFVATIKAMEEDGSLILQEPSYEIESALDYVFTLPASGWLWSTLGVTALALIAVTTIPDLFPLNVVRWLLGSIFVLYLPGYTLLQFLFPKGSEIDALERFALIIGVSLAIVPLIGLVLNFTPWGIRFSPITASLAAFTIMAAISAATRKYLTIRKSGSKPISMV